MFTRSASAVSKPHLLSAAAERRFASTECEREPIHIPGAIQPHGAFLAVLTDGFVVSHASTNLEAVLGHNAHEVLGQTLDRAFDVDTCRALKTAVHRGTLDSEPTRLIRGPLGGSLHLRAHRSGRHVCVDIEALQGSQDKRLPIAMAQWVLNSFEQAAGAVELCELAVHGLKTVSGYHRVMAYRFGEDGHGEVIAEARDEALPSLLGLRYPASDIPQQARQLYLRQRVGAIADASYTPVPLLVDPALDDGVPLDLSRSALRSVSPVHCEYMRNMGTAASLTVALVRGGALWGMLVCHHGTPQVAGPELRAAADMIGKVVSLLLGSLAEAELLAARLLRNVTLDAVSQVLARPFPLPTALASEPLPLLQLVDAGGALLRMAGVCTWLGRTPPHAAAEQALATLWPLVRGEPLAWDDLGRRFPELAACTGDGSGALLLPLSADNDDALLWFRPEWSRKVTWGGNPTAAHVVEGPSGRISPRRSFAAWHETVSGRSAPWQEVDLAMAKALRSVVQAEVARRTKAALLESEARLGLLAEHSGVVVMLSDLDGVRRYVSPAAERVLGWPPQDLLGRSVLEFVHPDDIQAVVDETNALMAGSQNSSACYRFRRPDGSWLWVDAHARLRADADGTGAKDYVVVMRDATRRKQDELKLLQVMARLERMAATDGLTGLSNRRHLDEAADGEWRRCSRAGLPLSVLLLDADRFKLFNDRYGHLAGDDCLRAIAEQLAAAAHRPGDVAARYGGEEFALLLPGSGADGAVCVARRICGLVQGLGLTHEGNAGYGVVTVSIGVATVWPGKATCAFENVAALFGAADAALYRAKSEGRNRVVIASSGPVAART